MILISAIFTKNGGEPATGLTLADIDLYLTRRRKSDGALTVLWDGTQNPTEEVTNIGAYTRSYTGEDTSLYDYLARASYTGATVLDTDHVAGVLAALTVTEIMEETVEGALSFLEFQRIMFAVLAGKSTGGGTNTNRFRDVADAKNRVDATVDANGNRTAISVDGT